MTGKTLGPLDRLLRRAFLNRLESLEHGELVIRDGAQTFTFGRRTAVLPVSATITVHDPAFYRQCALGGGIGAAEAWVSNAWTSDDLVGVIRIMAVNRRTLQDLERGLARLVTPLLKGFLWLRQNTRKGSRRNIAAHYDLGNEFFRQFLDPTMMYSSAVFETPQATLEEASVAKIDRLCRKLELGPEDHLLEIGTGWGALAVHAARHYGCRVTTTTISEEQFRLAVDRVKEAGLSAQVNVLQKDYRDLEGQYDKLVSVEMIEAVGHRYLGGFFEACSRLLKPDGQMLLQAITIADQEYDRARRTVDFIQRFIFPGSCLPSQAVMGKHVAERTDLRTVHVEDITTHYARTLAEWRHRFHANADAIRSMGFPEEFLRLWDFYFCYCEGGFQERVIGDVQVLYAKPLCRREPPLMPRAALGGERGLARSA